MKSSGRIRSMNISAILGIAGIKTDLEEIRNKENGKSAKKKQE